MIATSVLRQDVAPVLAAYLVFLSTLVAYVRAGKVQKRASHAIRDWRSFLRYLSTMFLGGFAAFLLIVVVFYFVLGARSSMLIRQALLQGSWFVFGIVLPSFVLLSVVTDRVARTRGRRPPGSDSA